jgi:hypothetical protein
MLQLSSIMIALETYYLLIIQSIIKTKHIKVHYHFVKKKVLTKEIDLVHVSTKNQVNIFTKVFKYIKVVKMQKHVQCTRCEFELKGECWKSKLN